MPKKRNFGSEGNSDDDDDDDYEEYRESDGVESKDEDDAELVVEEKTKVKIEPDAKERARNRKRMRKNDAILSDNDETGANPRKTDSGGYAHTLASKLRISKANRGNVPWNKSKKRSAADKAKISEGVRARNRAVLLEKLEKLGLTEEEWLEKKKEIKYLREKLRKAKLTNQQKEITENEHKLNAAISETVVEDDGKSAVNRKKKPVDTENKYARKVMMSKVKQVKPAASGAEPGNGSSRKRNKSAAAKPDVQNGIPSSVASAVPGAMLPAMFARDINWTYHPFDSSESDSPYDSTCPKGGPGGLICCEACTKSYSSFLTDSSKNLEEQRTRKVSNEVQELLGTLTSARSKLNNALRGAKQQSIHGSTKPVPRLGTAVTKKKAKQPADQLPQLPEFSFQFGENPPTLPEMSAAGVAQLPPMQNFESEQQVLDASPEAVAV